MNAQVAFIPASRLHLRLHFQTRLSPSELEYLDQDPSLEPYFGRPVGPKTKEKRYNKKSKSELNLVIAGKMRAEHFSVTST